MTKVPQPSQRSVTDAHRKRDPEQVEDLEHLEKAKFVDEVHTDEAIKVLARSTGDDVWTDVEEKQLRRKIDRRLLSIICVSYALQYYDKAMLGQTAIFGLMEDLNLGRGNRYSITSSIFYLGYIAGAYPLTWCVQRWPIERVAGVIIAIWGITLMSAAGVSNYQGIYAQRFFLGLVESGIAPMNMILIGGWYTKQEQAFRMGFWYSCGGYISIISPLINYGLGHITTGSLAPWQYMFLVAGGVTTLWSVVVYLYMPPDPIRATCFTEREKYIAVARLRTNNTGVRNVHFKAAQVWEALMDARFWLVFSMSFLMMFANAPASSFTPIIVQGFGFNALNSLLLTMPIGVVIGTSQWLAPWAGSYFRNARIWALVVCQTLVIIAALLLWLLPRTEQGGLMFALCIVTTFGGSYSILMALQIANTAGYTKRTFTSAGMYAGYCLGNFVAPLTFKEEDAPAYGPGFVVVVATASATAVLGVIYRYLCVWENARRDKTCSEGYDHAYEDDVTDTKVSSLKTVGNVPIG